MRRRDLNPDAPVLSLPGRRQGLGEPEGAGVEAVERSTLASASRRWKRVCPLWAASDPQHRSVPAPDLVRGQSIHQLRPPGDAEERRRADQHERPRSLHGQHLHRAAVATAEVRMRLPACLRDWLGTSRRIGPMDRLLQRQRPYSALAGRTPDEVYAKDPLTGIEAQKLAA